MQQKALEALLRDLPATELEGAGKLVLSLPDGSARSDALKELGKTWMPYAGDARGLLQSAGQFPEGADSDRLYDEMFPEGGQDDPCGP